MRRQENEPVKKHVDDGTPPNVRLSKKEWKSIPRGKGYYFSRTYRSEGTEFEESPEFKELEEQGYKFVVSTTKKTTNFQTWRPTRDTILEAEYAFAEARDKYEDRIYAHHRNKPMPPSRWKG